MKTFLHALLLAVLTTTLGLPAFAGPADSDPRWYFGAGMARLGNTPSADRISFEGPDARYSLNGLHVSQSESKKEIARSIFLGRFLNDWVALEMSYTQGLLAEKNTDAALPTYDKGGKVTGYLGKYVVRSQRDTKALGASLLWTWRPKLAEEKVLLFVRTGMERRMVQDEDSVDVCYFSQSSTCTKISVTDREYRRWYDYGSYSGIGLTYFPMEDVGIRVEHTTRTGSIKGTTLSFLYRY